MSPDELRQKTLELYEHLRRWLSGCSKCETGHDPGTHYTLSLPECHNFGQEIGTGRG